jgi:tetratricopeptide (TPR) repeat protein
MERAAGLDPLSLIIGTNRGLVTYLRHDYEAARQLFDDVLELDPNYEGALLGKALTLDFLDERASAWEIYQRLLDAAPESPHLLGFFAHSLASGGRPDACRGMMDRIENLRPVRFVSGSCMALPHLALGEIDAAFHWFDEAVAQRSAWMVYFGTEPRVNVIRDDPRFAQLLARLNLGYPADL